MADAAEFFSSLRGEPMNAVSFVMDYVEFHFNGQVLRALANPTLEGPTGRFEFPAEGSRDALCSLIEDTVAGIDVREHERLTLAFASGSTLTVPLDDGHRHGPEALHFINDGEFIVIW